MSLLNGAPLMLRSAFQTIGVVEVVLTTIVAQNCDVDGWLQVVVTVVPGVEEEGEIGSVDGVVYVQLVGMYQELMNVLTSVTWEGFVTGVVDV